MSQPSPTDTVAGTAEYGLRAELAQSDAALAAAIPVLRHVLLHPEAAQAEDVVVAHVRGLFEDIARQLAGDGAGELDALVKDLVDRQALLAQVHAAVLEALVTERVQREVAIDATRPLILRALAASGDGELATRLLEAQSRFLRQVRWMELPLAELPGTIPLAASDRHSRPNRLLLLEQAIAILGPQMPGILSIEQAGVAIFASALGIATGIERDQVVRSLVDGRGVRLALALRAAGQSAEEIEAQFLLLHPDGIPPHGIADVDPATARALLGADEDSAG